MVTCNCEDCKSKANKMIGFCKFCNLFYCLNHRLPESHMCINLVDCRTEHRNRNTEKLMNERCVASKI